MSIKKMISNPLSDYERKGLKICSKVLAQKSLLEANERKLCYQAGVVNKWFTNTIPRFTSLFIQLLNLKKMKKKLISN